MIKKRTCATNPTALFNKSSAVLSLDAHCTFLSETSAAKCAQMSISQDFAATPQNLFWGKPVLPRSVQHKEDSLRGQSIGVAIVTSLPARLPHQIDHTMFDACRFQEIWLQVGCLPVLCITVYGFHTDQRDHNHFNCVLLNSVLASASQTTGCVLIGGDLNAMLYPQEHRDVLASRGFVNLIEIAKHKWPEATPPTCRGSTWNDTILAKGPIASVFSSGWVDPEKSFGEHAPFFAQFSVPTQVCCVRRWAMPKNWMDLHPNAEDMERHFSITRISLQSPDAPMALETWAKCVEDAVSASLPPECGHQELPPRYLGRCKAPVFTMVQQTALPIPPAGQYTPPCDVLTYTAGHKVRQIRRVQSFAKSFMAASRCVSRQYPEQQLVQEWTAILRARGYHMPFKDWILKHVGHCPCEINDITHEWLLALEHRLKGDSDRYHARMNKYRKSDFTEKIQVECPSKCRIRLKLMTAAIRVQGRDLEIQTSK